jgi:hypothetical protein
VKRVSYYGSSKIKQEAYMGYPITLTPAGENWLIVPKPLAVNETPPSSIGDQKWLLVLTGVIITDDFTEGRSGAGIPGDNPHDWRRLTVTLTPDTSGALNYAVDTYGIPRPTVAPDGYEIIFSLDLWAPFVALSSSVDPSGSAAGCAVDVWRPTHFQTASDLQSNPIPNAFSGIDVDIAVFGGAILHRLSYSVSLVGRIVFGS